MKNKILFFALLFVLTACRQDKKDDFIDSAELTALMAANKNTYADVKANKLNLADYKQRGLNFLAANAKRSGVIVDPSGLQYEIISKEDGPKPEANDFVQVMFKVRLVDGSVLDDSIKDKRVLNLRLASMIRAWQIGLPLMSVGSRYRFFTPPNLGYNDNSDGIVPAESTFIFEVELVSKSKN